MRRDDRFRRRSTFFLVAAVVVVATLATSTYSLWRLRAEAIDRHFETATMHARTIEDHLTHSFNVIDLTLTTVADEARPGDALVAALRHAPYLRSLAVLADDGSIRLSSTPANVGARLPRGDFLPPANEARAILRVGRPWIGRDLADGTPATPTAPAPAEAQTLIPLLRDVRRRDDRWLTLAAAVNPDYFLNYYQRNLGDEAGSVDLYRSDGILMLSTDTRRQPGVLARGEALLAPIAGEEIARFERLDENGRATLSAVRGSPAFPFAIVVNLDKERVLDAWRHEAARTTGGLLLILGAALAVASLYFRRLERAARRHESDLEQLRLRSAALEAAANAIIITDKNGDIVWANRAFSTISGYPPDEIIGRNPRELIRSGRQSPAVYAELWQTIVDGRVWRGEMINRRKDGSHYPEDQTITPVPDAAGQIRHFVAVKQDISERRRNERRLAELSRHLVSAQEDARRRLSGELHDRTSPNLAAIGINLDLIVGMLRADESPELASRVEDVRALIADTNASIREICADLRPPALDHAGLVAALDGLAVQFARRTGIVVEFVGGERGLRLAPGVESLLFRIAQEALTNCAKHARAGHLRLTIESGDEATRLTVVDDGAGFSPSAPASGLGLVTMREMAELAGGRLRVDSAPGRGTRVEVELPRIEPRP